MTQTNKVVAIREVEADAGETMSSQALANKVTELRRQRRLSQAELDDLKVELDESLLNDGDAGNLMTKVALEEKKIEAYSRAIEKLERTALPDALVGEEAAKRSVARAAAQATYEARLKNARELVRLGALLDQQWTAFRESEDAYNAHIYEAGLTPKDLNNAAFVGAINALVPSMVEVLSTIYGTPVLGGDNPVALVRTTAPDRLRRAKN